MPVKDVYPATKKNGDPHPAAGLPKYKYTAKGEERVLKKRNTYKYAKKEGIDAAGKLQARLGLEVSENASEGETILAAGAKLTGGTSRGLVSKGVPNLQLIQAGRGSNLLLPKERPSKSRETIDYSDSGEVSRLFQTAGLKKEHRKKLGEFIAQNQDIFTKKGKLRKNKYVKKNTDSQDAAIADFMGQIETSNIFMKQTGLEGRKNFDDLTMPHGQGEGGLVGRAGGIGTGNAMDTFNFYTDEAGNFIDEPIRRLKRPDYDKNKHSSRFMDEPIEEAQARNPNIKGKDTSYRQIEGDAPGQIIGFSDPKHHKRAVRRMVGERGFKSTDYALAAPKVEDLEDDSNFNEAGEYIGEFRRRDFNIQAPVLGEEGGVYDATRVLMNQPVIVQRSNRSFNQVIMPSFVKAGRSAKNADILLSELTQN